jgi:hypothetical protein
VCLLLSGELSLELICNVDTIHEVVVIVYYSCDGSSHVRNNYCLRPAPKPPTTSAKPGAAPRADRQLVYIEGYSSSLPSSSSLLSLVSSIVQSTKLPSLNSILYVPSQ